MSTASLAKKLKNSDNIHAILVKYVGIAIMFLLQILLIKLASVKEYGAYVSLLAVCNILGTAAAFGQLTFLTKNVAINSVRSKR